MKRRAYKLGLTGSIGMGKTTTAEFFRELGVAVWDADATVHHLYEKDQAGALAIKKIAPGAVKEGAVDRNALRQEIIENPDLLKKIEAAIHPLVAESREEFIKNHQHEKIMVFDIPILFETGADQWLDGVLLVTADAETQKQRVMEREGMTEEVFQTILSKQMPDAEKRKRADFIIDTGKGIDHARAEVLSLIKRI